MENNAMDPLNNAQSFKLRVVQSKIKKEIRDY